MTAPWGHTDGWGRCRVEDRWYAVEGRLRVLSERPFEEGMSDEITVEVESVVVESELTSERRELGAEGWSLPLSFSYESYEDLSYQGGEVGDCRDDD